MTSFDLIIVGSGPAGLAAASHAQANGLSYALLERTDHLADTVDAYQGREADLVMFSITRSNRQGKAGFLSERERINVALSRARYGLCLVGDADFCKTLVTEVP